MRCGLRSAHQGGMRVKNIYVGEWPKPPACGYERPNSVSGGERQRYFLCNMSAFHFGLALFLSLFCQIFFRSALFSSYGQREFLESC